MRGAIALLHFSLASNAKSHFCMHRESAIHTHPHTYTHAQQYPQVVVERNYTLADSIESH